MELNIWGIESGLPEDEFTTTQHCADGNAAPDSNGASQRFLEMLTPMFMRKSAPRGRGVFATSRQLECDSC